MDCTKVQVSYSWVKNAPISRPPQHYNTGDHTVHESQHTIIFQTLNSFTICRSYILYIAVPFELSFADASGPSQWQIFHLWSVQICELEQNWIKPGIKPGSLACQVGCLTITLLVQPSLSPSINALVLGAIYSVPGALHLFNLCSHTIFGLSFIVNFCSTINCNTLILEAGFTTNSGFTDKVIYHYVQLLRSLSSVIVQNAQLTCKSCCKYIFFM